MLVHDGKVLSEIDFVVAKNIVAKKLNTIIILVAKSVSLCQDCLGLTFQHREKRHLSRSNIYLNLTWKFFSMVLLIFSNFSVSFQFSFSVWLHSLVLHLCSILFLILSRWQTLIVLILVTFIFLAWVNFLHLLPQSVFHHFSPYWYYF